MATSLGSLKRPRGFPGVVVDGFLFQGADATAYLLTHFHSDHTCGLSASFRGPAKIYASPITARLVVQELRVPEQLVVPLELGMCHRVPGAGGAAYELVLLDANHCPGAVMMFLRDPASGTTLLHTGDFRAAPCVREDHVLRGLLAERRLDDLYLDTTYLDKRWYFPPQEEVLRSLGDIVREELEREPQTLFLVGSYSIGKERAIAAVTRAAGGRASVSDARARKLRATGWWDDAMFSTDNDSDEVCKVRVTGMDFPSHERLLDVLAEGGGGRWKAVVAFRPTGWAFTKRQAEQGYKPWVENDGATRIFSIPYSEHSSFDELKEFVAAVRPRRVTPTVNAETDEQRTALISHFVDHIDLATDKRRMDFYFGGGGVGVNGTKRKAEDETPAAGLADAEQESLAAAGVTAAEVRAQQAILENIRSEGGGRDGGCDARAGRENENEAHGGFPPGCVAVVRGGRYVQFKDRAHVEKRLRELGADVRPSLGGPGPAVTHIVVPANGERAAEALRAQKKRASGPLTVTEGWVMRHLRAARSAGQ